MYSGSMSSVRWSCTSASFVWPVKTRAQPYIALTRVESGSSSVTTATLRETASTTANASSLPTLCRRPASRARDELRFFAAFPTERARSRRFLHDPQRRIHRRTVRFLHTARHRGLQQCFHRQPAAPGGWHALDRSLRPSTQGPKLLRVRPTGAKCSLRTPA